MKYQRGDAGVTLMIVMMVLMMGYFTLRGHDGTGIHHVAENVQTGAANPPSVSGKWSNGAIVKATACAHSPRDAWRSERYFHV